MPNLAANRTRPGEPQAGGGHGGSGFQVIGHLVQQGRQLPAEIVDGLLGGLHPQWREEEPAEHSRAGAHERLEYPAGRGGARAQRQDQHGADRYLQDVNAEAQDVSDGKANGDHDHQAPPREADQGGEGDGDEHARDDAHDPLERVADRLVHGGLHDEQRGQRRQHGLRADRQLQRHQVGERRGNGQPRDVRGWGLGPAADQGQGRRRGVDHGTDRRPDGTVR